MHESTRDLLCKRLPHVMICTWVWPLKPEILEQPPNASTNIIIILIDVVSARPSASLPIFYFCVGIAMAAVQNRMPTSLCELGGLERRPDGYRARIPRDRITAGRRGHHNGPLRDTEAEALPDLAVIRGADPRADVGSVVARLRANAGTHRAHREATQDVQEVEQQYANAAPGHTDVFGHWSRKRFGRRPGFSFS